MVRRVSEDEIEAVDVDFEPQNGVANEEDEAAEVALARVITELGDAGETGKVMLYKKDKNKQDVYLTEYPVETFNEIGLEGVRAEFGGGEFLVRVYSRGRLRTRKILRLADIHKTESPMPQIDVTNTLAAMMQTFQQSMQEQNRVLMAGLASLHQSPPQQSRREMFEEMMLMKQLFASDNRGNGMDAFIKGVEAAKNLAAPAGEATGADVFLEMVKQFAPLIAQNAAQAPRAPQRPPIPAPQKAPIPERRIEPAPAPANPPAFEAVQNPQLSPDETDMSLILKMQLQVLCRAARSGIDPRQQAVQLYNSVPDEILNDFIDDPLLIDKLNAINSEIGLHRHWFEMLLAEVRRLDAEDNEEGADEPIENQLTNNVLLDSNDGG